MKRWVTVGWGNRKHRWRITIGPALTAWLLWVMIGVIVGVVLWATVAAARDSQYRVTGNIAVNQVEHYPVRQALPSDRYRPVGNWVGRLILPSPAEAPADDWVWMEVYHGPEAFRDLQGQRLRLEWRSAPAVQQYVAAVTRDVTFIDAVAASQEEGNLHPDRLNGRAQVGPLQSLAGARPIDDVVVSLDAATVLRQSGKTRLQIDVEPTVESGRSVGLVQILAPVDRKGFIPSDCPGKRPCPSELFQVQHYSATSGRFDGAKETIRIPQQPRDLLGVFASTPRNLPQSPAGKAGWYIYGAADKTGLFTVQALKPRALFQLQPQQTIADRAQGLNYINYDHWHNIERRKGRIETVLIDSTKQAETSPIALQVGQRALVMHLFGGRGGRGGESPVLGTVTGHFSYGLPPLSKSRSQRNYNGICAINRFMPPTPTVLFRVPIPGRPTWGICAGAGWERVRYPIF